MNFENGCKQRVNKPVNLTKQHNVRAEKSDKIKMEGNEHPFEMSAHNREI